MLGYKSPAVPGPCPRHDYINREGVMARSGDTASGDGTSFDSEDVRLRVPPGDVEDVIVIGGHGLRCLS